MNRPTFAVLGAGHGGLALAGHLGLLGHRVHLWSRNPGRIAPVAWAGGVHLEGVVRGFGPVAKATTRLHMVLEDADVIMVAVPASAHRSLAEQCAPHLKDHHTVLLNPGRTLGAVEFRHVLDISGCEADPLIGEAQTFLYASRATGPARACIHGIKKAVPVAALPAARTSELVAKVRPALRVFEPAGCTLQTSLDNMGAIFHPPVTLLNAARIESTSGNFQYYHEGITPAVARILEAIDRERLAIAGALGVRVMSAREWLGVAYGAEGEDLWSAVHANRAYAGIRAPQRLEHRYLDEDVPCSLVPLACLGEAAGVEVKTITQIIDLACLALGRDYWAEGRTLKRVGLAGWDAAHIARYVTEGEMPLWLTA